jgi:hypothetical protein
MSPDHPSIPRAVATTPSTVDRDGTQPAASPLGPAPARLPELTGGWLAGAWALVALAIALAIGGFANSFTAVRDAVEPSFGPLAWTVPVLIDVGVAVFSGIDLLFTRLGMRLWWLRLVPWALIGATIWLNVADETTSIGIVAHAAPPILWVMVVELATHAMRARSGLDTDGADRRRAAGRMDKVRASRWLLAPWSTLVIRRWMILQEERSYERANARWWARKEAKWDLQDTYGPLVWRVRAPRRDRGLYRWGHLTTSAATDPQPTVSTNPPTLTPPEAADVGPSAAPAAAARQAGARQRGRSRRPARGRDRAGFDDFEAAAAELRAEGRPVNRTLVMNRLRGRGMSLANDRADEYLARLHDPEAA